MTPSENEAEENAGSENVLNAAPMADLIFVHVPEPARIFNGIIIPDTVDEEVPMEGKVTACGPLVEELKEGDKVLFRKHTGTLFNIAHRVWVMEEAEVLAVVEDA